MYAILGFFLAFTLSTLINYLPKKTDQKLILHLDGNCYHIHHWIIVAILVFLAFVVKYSSDNVFYTIIGILAGFAAEDFLFRNVFSIRTPCP